MMWVSLFFALLLNSCKDTPLQIDPALLQGQWSTACYCDGHQLRSDWITFEDSVFNKSWAGYLPFRIYGDTLLLKRHPWSSHFSGQEEADIFRIVSLSQSTLTLVQIIPDGYRHIPQPIQYKRLVRQSQDKIREIALFYHPFGRGPRMNSYQYIELKDDGRVYMEGYFYNDSIFGKYLGKLDPVQCKIISDMAAAIFLDTLRPAYALHATHQDSYKMMFRTGTKTYTTEAYGFNGQSGALTMLINKLLFLFNQLEPLPSSASQPNPAFTEFYAARQDIIDRSHLWHPRHRMLSFRRDGIELANQFASYEFEFGRDSTLYAIREDTTISGQWLPIRLDSATHDWAWKIEFRDHHVLSKLNGTYRNGNSYPANHIYSSIDPAANDTFQIEFISRCYY
jgi:hypothetical protein